MNSDRDSWVRLLCLVALVIGTYVFLNSRALSEDLPASQPLSSLPPLIGEWAGHDVALSSDVLQVLGHGEFLTRIYRSVHEAPIDLYIAYFPSQKTGSTIHSPQNCLPGAGWTPVEYSTISLSRPDKSLMTINRYIIAKRMDRQLVLYWYQSHGRVVASEYSAKYYLVADSIRMDRSDGALVRVITGIKDGEDEESAERRAGGFTQQLVPLLDTYIPR
jgi:EpsI family protein